MVGVKDRETNQVDAQVVPDTTKETLQGIIMEKADANAQVFTDEHQSYQGLPFAHATVKHSVSEYLNGMAHNNGMESFWAMLKRGYHGIPQDQPEALGPLCERVCHPPQCVAIRHD